MLAHFLWGLLHLHQLLSHFILCYFERTFVLLFLFFSVFYWSQGSCLQSLVLWWPWFLLCWGSPIASERKLSSHLLNKATPSLSHWPGKRMHIGQLNLPLVTILLCFSSSPTGLAGVLCVTCFGICVEMKERPNTHSSSRAESGETKPKSPGSYATSPVLVTERKSLLAASEGAFHHHQWVMCSFSRSQYHLYFFSRMWRTDWSSADTVGLGHHALTSGPSPLSFPC